MSKKNAVIVIILIASALTLLVLSAQLWAMVLYQRALTALRTDDPAGAQALLERSIEIQSNDARLWKALGHSFMDMAQSAPPAESIQLRRQAKSAFLAARSQNPLDVEIAIWLARVSASLEGSPDRAAGSAGAVDIDAADYYIESLRLRPNSTLYHYEFANYLYYAGRYRQLMQVITKLGFLRPDAYYQLRSKPYWLRGTQAAFLRGLENNINAGLSPRQANLIYSEIMTAERQWEDAYRYYQAFINADGWVDHLYLGRLYLELNRLENARDQFIAFCKHKTDWIAEIETIFWLYDAKRLFNARLDLFRQIREIFPHLIDAQLFYIRCLIFATRYAEAERIILELAPQSRNPQLFYWLSRLTMAQERWTETEAAIRRAIAHDPGNWKYHYSLALTLFNMRNFHNAESAIEQAMLLRQNPVSWYHELRAMIRWQLGKFQASVQDWQLAISLDPGNVKYLQNASQSLVAIGDTKTARDYLRQAMDLDPGNVQLRKTYQRLVSSNEAEPGS